MGKVTIPLACRFKVKCITEEVFKLEVNEEDWKEWYTGSPRHVQEVFPYLSSGQREMLISGMCPKCWDGLITEA